MTGATPPPEEPLGEQARQRIRAGLLAATKQAGPPRSRRWVVPATAAASVALVAGLTAWATGAVGGDPDDGTGPATGASSSPEPTPAPPPAEPTPSETVPPDTVPPDTVPPESASSGTATTQPPATPTPTDHATCPPELRYVLRGAEQVAVFPEGDGGTTSYWVKGGRFSLCDARSGTTTVHKPLPLEPDLGNVETWRVSSLYPPTDDGYRTIRVAGGLVPDGLGEVFTVSYSFPDGHTEKATTTVDDQGRTWWRMLYEYDDGGGDEMTKPPIEVTYSLSGVQESFTLDWGTDTCAQANHGC